MTCCRNLKFIVALIRCIFHERNFFLTLFALTIFTIDRSLLFWFDLGYLFSIALFSSQEYTPTTDGHTRVKLYMASSKEILHAGVLMFSSLSRC